MAEAPPKPKRRRRIATPPPDDENIIDFYDQGVSTTFDMIKSGKLNVCITPEPESRLAVITPDESREDEIVIDLETERVLTRQAAAAAVEQPVQVECEPPSPPAGPAPPSASLTHRTRRLGHGVRAAFNKLEKLCSSIEQDAYSDAVEQVPESSAQVTNTKIKVRVRMLSGIQRYNMDVNDRLFNLREHIAKRESTSATRISLFFNDSAITEYDTAKGLGLTVADTVEAYLSAEGKEPAQPEPSDELLNIRVQGKHGVRDVEHILLAPDEPVDVLMKKFAESKKLDLSSLQFYFDGEKISSTDTPTSLDMEDGDCIDVKGY